MLQKAMLRTMEKPALCETMGLCNNVALLKRNAIIQENFWVTTMSKCFVDGHTINTLKLLLANTLGLPQPPSHWQEHTGLLQSIPELDSMTIVSWVAAIEEHFGITFTDDDMTAESFETFKTIGLIVEAKQAP